MLGDMVTSALRFAGVTEESVAQWLGRPCDCAEYRAKLNALTAWGLKARRLDQEEAARRLDQVVKET